MLFGISPEIYTLTLMMPALSYGLILLVFRYMPRKEGYSAWKDLGAAAVIPVGWYVAVNVLVPFSRQLALWKINSGMIAHTVAILFVASSVLFLFFLTRMVCVLLVKAPRVWQIARIPVVIVLPLLGLAVNNGAARLLPVEFSFGDFSHPAFYIVALLMGALLLLPPFENKTARLAIFFGKSLTLVYTSYFFLVFLPYLPLSIAAVVAAGLGFLMLTPLVLMFIHLRSLWEDFSYLSAIYRRYRLVLVFVLGIAILPAAVTFSYNNDRVYLNQALKYMYEPDYSKPQEMDINTAALKRTFDNIKANRDESGRLGRIAAGGRKPYLSAYYKWLVLDNLTLSDKRISEMERVFLGDTGIKVQDGQVNNGGNEDIGITGIKTETVPSEDGKGYKSWIHLEIKNSGSVQQEFATKFTLPAGCWISNYYLDVAGERKYGLLADKRAAVWTYDQITTWRRDPGILYYLEDGSTVFKVFPFQPGEVRKTGIEVIHKGEVVLDIGGNEIRLAGQAGSSDNREVSFTSGGKAAFIPAAVKEGLQVVSRKPFYIFVLDFSSREKDSIAGITERVGAFMQSRGIKAGEAGVIAVNSVSRELPAQPGWDKGLSDFPVQGGFFLDRAVRKALTENEAAGGQNRPIIITVSDYMENAIILGDFSSFTKTLPGDMAYYELHTDGQLYENTLLGGNAGALPETAAAIPEKQVLLWQQAGRAPVYLPDDGQGSLVLLDKQQDLDAINLEEATWDNGFALAAMNQALYANPSGYSRKARTILENSFRTGIMTPQTSYIVVENEAQEQALLEKQRQLLASQKNLDASDAEERMSEPSLMAVAGIAVLLYLLRLRKKKLKPAF